MAFRATYRLDATTTVGARVHVPISGQLSFQPDGAFPRAVSPGATLGVQTIPVGLRAARSGSDRNALERAKVFAGLVSAPVAGRATRVADGIDIVEAGLDIAASLTPVQALRIKALPFAGTATVETVFGQQKVTCLAVWTEHSATANASASDAGAADSPASTLSAHCRLPKSVESAPGLVGQLTLRSPEFKNVLVVPSSTISYDDAKDRYYVTLTAGAGQDVEVIVGPTDGVVRVVEPVGGTLKPGDVLAPAQ